MGSATLPSPEDDVEFISLDLSLCDDHGEKIMNGLKSRNLWQFVGDDAGAGIKSFMNRHGVLGAGRNKDGEKVPYDPLVEIHMEIIFRAMANISDGEMEPSGCPLCKILNPDEWMNKAMDSIEMHFRSKGWMKETVN
jgi:hypothetical protein